MKRENGGRKIKMAQNTIARRKKTGMVTIIIAR
jgi:hypothetical protein